MTFDLNLPDLWVLQKDRCHLIEQTEGALLNGRLTRIEVDRVEDLDARVRKLGELLLGLGQEHNVHGDRVIGVESCWWHSASIATGTAAARRCDGRSDGPGGAGSTSGTCDETRNRRCEEDSAA